MFQSAELRYCGYVLGTGETYGFQSQETLFAVTYPACTKVVQILHCIIIVVLGLAFDGAIYSMYKDV